MHMSKVSHILPKEKRIVSYLQLVSAFEMVCQYVFHFWSACTPILFFLRVNTVSWHFGLESRKTWHTWSPFCSLE